MSTSNEIKDITFSATEMTVHFTAGQKITTPLSWYPRLQSATIAQRNRWEILGRNRGIHWPQLDEDLSIAGLLAGTSITYPPTATDNEKRIS